MVTSTHEASHRIFQEHPEVLTPVFEALGLPPPRKAVISALTPDATEIRPLERRVDSVLKVEPSEGDGFLVAIEAQTKRAPDKGINWAYYVAYLHAKFGLPVLLVTVCRNPATATWAAGPFNCRVGTWTTQITQPFVLGPGNTPLITDESVVARQSAIAAFSAMVHSESKKITAILDTLARGMRFFDKGTAMYWCELVEVGLGETPARETWRGLQKLVATYFPGHGTLFEETYLAGKTEDRASLVLRALEKRGIPVSQDIHDRITSCTDLDTLTLWFDRALTATTAEELFAENSKAEDEGDPSQA